MGNGAEQRQDQGKWSWVSMSWRLESLGWARDAKKALQPVVKGAEILRESPRGQEIVSAATGAFRSEKAVKMHTSLEAATGRRRKNCLQWEMFMGLIW